MSPKQRAAFKRGAGIHEKFANQLVGLLFDGPFLFVQALAKETISKQTFLSPLMHAPDSPSPRGNSRNSSSFFGKAAEAANGVVRQLLTFLLALSVLVLSVVASRGPLERELDSVEADLAVQAAAPSGGSWASSSGLDLDGTSSELPSETDSESDVELEEKFETELWLPPHDVMSLRVEVRSRTSAPPVSALENQWLRDGLERPPRA